MHALTPSPQDSYFAPPERADAELLRLEVEVTSKNPIIDGLLKTVGGLLAVLNEQRQILALNDTLLSSLGLEDVHQALGLRPGEAINCIHARELPGGCGTTKFCASCGAAIAIVSCMESDHPEERFCVATAKRQDKEVDICFSVRACPARLEGHRFILLFLQDCTQAQQQAAFMRVFFHDITNIIHGVQNVGDLLALPDAAPSPEITNLLQYYLTRLTTEVKIHQILFKDGEMDYKPRWQTVSVRSVLQEIQRYFSLHPLTQGKRLVIADDLPADSFQTDITLLLRILGNMLTNALEAAEPGDEVKLWVEPQPQALSFCVWNRQPIPEKVALRIFQRNFSTKYESGRGWGTFAMKLFGERILGGRVSFTTSEAAGTVFRFSHPQ